MTAELVPIEKIKLTGNTQVRVKLSQETIEEYAEAGKRRKILPPITLFTADKIDYWLADGWHRYHAAMKSNATQVRADVKEGDAKDAQWYAIGANQTHGLPRSKADKANAIKMALEARPEESDNAIAEYVGVSHNTVTKAREKMEKDKHSEATKQGMETAASSNDNSENTSSSGVNTQNSENGAQGSPSQTTTAGKAKTDAPMTDEEGHAIPERCLKFWAVRDPMTKFMTAASRLAQDIAKAAGALKPEYQPSTPGYERLDVANIVLVHAKNIRTAFTNSRPTHVCPYCKGKGCKTCQNTGLLAKGKYNAAPQDLKDAMPQTPNRKD